MVAILLFTWQTYPGNKFEKSAREADEHSLFYQDQTRTSPKVSKGGQSIPLHKPDSNTSVGPAKQSKPTKCGSYQLREFQAVKLATKAC
jgi:hypothetical protein